MLRYIVNKNMTVDCVRVENLYNFACNGCNEYKYYFFFF